MSIKANKNSYTANNWYFGLFNGKMKFEKVRDPEGILKFDKSLVNKKSLLKPIHLEKYLVLSNKNRTQKMVMGGGHFACTLRRQIFDFGPNEPAFIKIVGGVENKYIDKPTEDLGFLRVSTLNNFAYHLGNTFEKWMTSEFEKIKINVDNPSFSVQDFKVKPHKRFNIFIGKFIQKLMSKSKKIKLFILNRLGLKSDKF